MTNREDAQSASARLRARVVAQITELSGDRTTAEEIAGLVAVSGLDRLAGPETERLAASLEELAISLAGHDYRSRRAREALACLAPLVARAGDDPDPTRLAAALDTLSVQERIALEMIHVDGYDHAKAAEFFELRERAVARLAGRARRRLRRAYAQLGGGTVGAVIAVVADHVRRRCVAFGRLTAESTEAVAHWATLNPAPAIATTAAGLSLAVAVAVVVPGDTEGRVRRRPPAVAVASSLSIAPHARGQASSSADTPSEPTASPQRGPVVVRQAVQRQPTGASQTRYSQQATAPAPPPPAEAPPENDPDMLGFFTFYECPQPGERLIVETFACPLVAS